MSLILIFLNDKNTKFKEERFINFVVNERIVFLS